MDKEVIKSALRKGLVQIFSASFINQVIGFVTVIILGNIISKVDYGYFADAKNNLDIALLVQGLGVTQGILQYSSVAKEQKEKYEFFSYGFKIGIVTNVAISIILMVYAMFTPYIMDNTRHYLIIMSWIPLTKIVYDTIQCYLRATLRNKEYSRLTVFNTVIYLLSTTILSYCMGAKGVIIGMYITYIVTAVLGVYIIREDIFHYKGRTITDIDAKKQFLKFSLITMLSNVMTQMLYLIDTKLIVIFAKDPEITASYSMATKIPFNLTFISIAIITFAYPYFAQNKDNKKWIKDKLSFLLKALGIINLVISIGGIIFANQIFNLLWPDGRYLSSVPSFRVLMFGYFIVATFRIPYGNIIAALGNAKANLINAIFSGVANVILDVVLILKYGSIGAAYATTAVYIISSVIHHIFITKHIRNMSD